LIPVGKSEFFMLDFWARLEFVQDSAGNVTELVYRDGNEFRAKRK
jgi:hypothetical protein